MTSSTYTADSLSYAKKKEVEQLLTRHEAQSKLWVAIVNPPLSEAQPELKGEVHNDPEEVRNPEERTEDPEK